VQSGQGTAPLEQSVMAYLDHAAANRLKETSIVSKVKVAMEMDGKSISTSGTLRMKRDDVIQISLVDPLVGIAEILRMEFTKTHVLIIDRFNKQYIDVPYKDVSFLQRANVDFNTLQSLFWNEVFQPGKSKPQSSAFQLQTNTDSLDAKATKVELTCKDNMLNYLFAINPETTELQSTVIADNSDKTAQFAFDYSQFASFGGRTFPRSMRMSFVMGRRKASLAFSLNSLKANSDWETRTNVPKKYKQADPEKIFHSLIN
jgi:hypothetical protein